MYTESYVESSGSFSRFAFSYARKKRIARRMSAETAQQTERMSHGMWLRGWYLASQYCGPAAFPTAYPIMTIAFVVKPKSLKQPKQETRFRKRAGSGHGERNRTDALCGLRSSTRPRRA